ncbi:MAG: hypothetical protein Q9176_004524 [Flavoplaca citrina]
MTNTTNISHLPASDRQSNIISIFFGLAAVLFSLITIWQARRMWKAWVNRPDMEVFELATHDIGEHRPYIVTPTLTEESGSPDDSSESQGPFLDLRGIDRDCETM